MSTLVMVVHLRGDCISRESSALSQDERTEERRLAPVVFIAFCGHLSYITELIAPVRSITMLTRNVLSNFIPLWL